MKKQYVFCRTALLLCVWLFSSAAWAYDFEADGIYYNILSSDDKTVAVTYYKSHYGGDYSGDVTIPETVTYEGTEYRVIAIGNEAFWYCDSLTEITIPESVTAIGEYTFWGCDGLTSVTAYNPIPVDIVITYEWGDTYSSFEGDRTNCTLYVPAESVELYKVVEGWKEFGEILPIDESSAITETRQEQADGHVTVYNLQGVLVLETDDAADLKTLQNGAYIVNGKKMIIVR